MLYVAVLYVAFSALLFMLLIGLLSVSKNRYIPLEMRPVMAYPTSLVSHLHAIEWASWQFDAEAERLKALGHPSAELYADFAHIRQLEERLEAERFEQARARKASVRAIVRVQGA